MALSFHDFKRWLGNEPRTSEAVIVSDDKGSTWREIPAADFISNYGGGGGAGLTKVTEVVGPSDIGLHADTGYTFYLLSDTSAGISSEDGETYISVDQAGQATMQSAGGVVVQAANGDVFIGANPAHGRIDLEGIVGGAWHEIGTLGEPAFESGATNFSGAFNSCAFYKAGDRVYLKGVTNGGVQAEDIIFTLPVNYRPSVKQVVGQAGCAWLIHPEGWVQAKVEGSFGFWTLDGISFRIAL